MEQQLEQVKHLGNAVALGLTGGTAIGWLPAIPSVIFASIWWLIRIYETRTVQGLLHRMRR